MGIDEKGSSRTLAPIYLPSDWIVDWVCKASGIGCLLCWTLVPGIESAVFFAPLGTYTPLCFYPMASASGNLVVLGVGSMLLYFRETAAVDGDWLASEARLRFFMLWTSLAFMSRWSFFCGLFLIKSMASFRCCSSTWGMNVV